MVTVDNNTDKVLDGLIDCLTRTLTAFRYSNTVDFKLIAFRDNAIKRDGLTELFT